MNYAINDTIEIDNELYKIRLSDNEIDLYLEFLKDDNE